MKQIADGVMSTAKDVTEGKKGWRFKLTTSAWAARFGCRGKRKLGKRCHGRMGQLADDYVE